MNQTEKTACLTAAAEDLRLAEHLAKLADEFEEPALSEAIDVFIETWVNTKQPPPPPKRPRSPIEIMVDRACGIDS